MKKREGAIISAFTGILCGEFSSMHGYVEELLGRRVWTHEFGNKEFTEELKKKAKPDFLKLCKDQED